MSRLKGFRFMKADGRRLARLCSTAALLVLVAHAARAQGEQPKSIGGPEHEDNILGVRIGMDVPTALQAVFVNAQRRPGQERPDAKRNEGKDKKDVRVLYKGLKAGDLEIVFADGQWVKEIALRYAGPIPIDDLRLPPSSDIGAAMGGERYDDRYTVGYTGANKLERYWWRDEQTPGGYRVRVGFVSERLAGNGQLAGKTIARKLVGVTPGDEEKFKRAMASR